MAAKSKSKFSFDGELAMMPPSPIGNCACLFIGLIKRKGDENWVTVENLYIGKSYVNALGESLKYFSPTSINLSSVKNNEDGVVKIIETLKPNIERLELGSSSVDSKAIK